MTFIWLPAPPRFRRRLGWRADIQALRSASGQNSIGSDRILAFTDGSICCVANIGKPSGRFVKPDVVTDDLAERLIGLRRFQTTIEVDCRLDIAVGEQAPHRLVLSGPMLEIDRRASMAELM